MFNRFSLLLLFLSMATYAQLYVGSSSYMFNKGALLYATGNVNLNGGNVYLRNEGQLIQGTSGSSTNTGTGVVSVVQEGTSNNYCYNYWCSPVGAASSASGNENFSIAQLYQPTSNIASTAATLLSTSNLNGIANPLSIASYWIWKFQTSGTYADWIYVGTAATLAAGQGFTMKGTSGTDTTNIGETATNNPGSAQRYDFRGKPNDGTISVNVSNNNYTLTGNPYPSALHMNAFLLDAANSACTGIAYYWEQDKTTASHGLLVGRGGYGTYAPVNTSSTGIYTPAVYYNYNADGSVNSGTGSNSSLSIVRKYAPIGQGFMVQGNASGTVYLKNSHRSYYKESNATGYSQFEKNGNNHEETFGQLWLHVGFNQSITRPLVVAFPEGATDQVDHGMDADDPAEADLPFNSYFLINNKPYVIECLPFGIEKRIPIGVKTTQEGQVRFQLKSRLNFDPNQAVYLFDADTGLYHALTDDSDYVTTVAAGQHTHRFWLTFVNAELNNPQFSTQQGFQLGFQAAQHQLTLYNVQNLPLKSVAVYDMTGKLIEQQVFKNQATSPTFDCSAWAYGAYGVKIELENGSTHVLKALVYPN